MCGWACCKSGWGGGWWSCVVGLEGGCDVGALFGLAGFAGRCDDGCGLGGGEVGGGGVVGGGAGLGVGVHGLADQQAKADGDGLVVGGGGGLGGVAVAERGHGQGAGGA